MDRKKNSQLLKRVIFVKIVFVKLITIIKSISSCFFFISSFSGKFLPLHINDVKNKIQGVTELLKNVSQCLPHQYLHQSKSYNETVTNYIAGRTGTNCPMGSCLTLALLCNFGWGQERM